MNGPSPNTPAPGAGDVQSVFVRPKGEPGPHVVRQPYVPAVCLWCSETLPLVALEPGQPAAWHDAGGGTYHACARREVSR